METKISKHNAIVLREELTKWTEGYYRLVSNTAREMISEGYLSKLTWRADKETKEHSSGLPYKMIVKVMRKATENIKSKGGVQDDDLLRLAASNIVNEMMKEEYGRSDAGLPEPKKTIKKPVKGQKIVEDDDDDLLIVKQKRCDECNRVKRVRVGNEEKGYKRIPREEWKEYGIKKPYCTCHEE